jgi:hypothetical protein
MQKRTVILNWHVDDGYVGGDRPHATKINIDMLDTDVDDDELAEQLRACVADHFQQNILLDLTDEEVSKAVQSVRALATQDAE